MLQKLLFGGFFTFARLLGTQVEFLMLIIYARIPCQRSAAQKGIFLQNTVGLFNFAIRVCPSMGRIRVLQVVYDFVRDHILYGNAVN